MGPAKAGLFKEEAKESEENEEKRVGSWQLARKRSAELKKVYQKTLWAGLKRILLLRFLCFRKIFGTGFIMNMCNFLIAGEFAVGGIFCNRGWVVYIY